MMKLKVVLFVWGAIILMARPQALPAQITPTQITPMVKYEYYDVYINDDGAIVDAAFSATPIRLSGRKYLGDTQCRINYDYEVLQKNNANCLVGDNGLAINCRVLLPRFIGGGGQARANLEAFMERLRYHELQHVRISKDCALQFAKEVGFGRQYGCDVIVEYIRTRLDKMNAECQAVQERYDRNTRHGQTEGADLEWHLASEEDRPLMAPGATAPAARVIPQIEYAYYETPVSPGSRSGAWRQDLGGLIWRFIVNYTSRRNDDDSCRVLKYNLTVACELKLPRLTGGDPELRATMERIMDEAKKAQLARCGLVAAEAEKFVQAISGPKTFQCDRMKMEIDRLREQMIDKAKNSIKRYDSELARQVPIY